MKKDLFDKVQALIDAADALGWHVAFKGNAKAVQYVVAGKPKEVDRVLDLIEASERKKREE